MPKAIAPYSALGLLIFCLPWLLLSCRAHLPTATGDGLQVSPMAFQGPRAGALALRIERPHASGRHIQAFPQAGWDTAKIFFDSASARTQAASLAIAKTALIDNTASSLPTYAYTASSTLPPLRPASDYAIGVDLYASAAKVLNGFGYVAHQTLNSGANAATVMVTNNLDADLLAGSVDPGNRNGTSALFNQPNGLAFDASGNLLVADSGSNRIRKIDFSANVTTIAGNGTGSQGLFDNPQGVVYYGGYLYIANTNANAISQLNLTTGAVVLNWAGGNGNGYADGIGAAVMFDSPKGITVDATGNFFVADTKNGLIRKISGGNVTTIAGVWTSSTNPGAGPGTGYAGAASFSNPTDITADASGNLYVADSNNNEICFINQTIAASSASYVTTIANSGPSGAFKLPSGVALNATGDLFITDTNNHQVDKIAAITHTVTVVAGTINDVGQAATDGVAVNAGFSTPVYLTCRGSKLYVADMQNHAIRVIDLAANMVSTLAGGKAPGWTDGLMPTFRNVQGIAVDATGNVFVADGTNNNIREIAPNGTVTTLAVGDGYSGGQNAHKWHLSGPAGLALDSAGNLYLANTSWSRLQQIAPSDVAQKGIVDVNTGATFGAGVLPCPTANLKMANPSGVAVDASGTLYVADSDNNRIVKITGYVPYPGAGGGTASLLAGGLLSPRGVCVDLHGNVYEADKDSGTVNKITSAGVVSTLAGSPAIGSADDVACDGIGNVFVCDTGRSAIYKIDPTGVLTLVAGGNGGYVNGIGAGAQFFTPVKIAVDASDVLYVADRDNHVVRIIH